MFVFVNFLFFFRKKTIYKASIASAFIHSTSSSYLLTRIEQAVG
jgi:hypothetical protein